MSAVSSGSPRATADLNAQSANGSASGSGDAAEVVEAGADFGPNQWLVDELYEQYKKDRNSVDKAWWSFFEDYTPGDGGSDALADRRRSRRGRRAGRSRGAGHGQVLGDPGGGMDGERRSEHQHQVRGARQPVRR